MARALKIVRIAAQERYLAGPKVCHAKASSLLNLGALLKRGMVLRERASSVVPSTNRVAGSSVRTA